MYALLRSNFFVAVVDTSRFSDEDSADFSQKPIRIEATPL